MYLKKIILFTNPLRTYNKIKLYFKSIKGFFYFGKQRKVPLTFWNPNFLITSSDVMWKDKFHSPRFEESPYFLINLFGYSIGYIWKFEDEDEYWEQALWYLYYANGDIDKAKETWPWVNMDKKSTWSDEFLKM